MMMLIRNIIIIIMNMMTGMEFTFFDFVMRSRPPQQRAQILPIFWAFLW
nr:hypothetical protein Q903MT_gene1975 [Picea sitchensis]